LGGAVSESSRTTPKLREVSIHDPDLVKKQQEANQRRASPRSDRVVTPNVESLKYDTNDEEDNPEDEPEANLLR